MFYERNSPDDVCAADNEVFLVVYVDSFLAPHQDCDVTCDVCQLSQMMLSWNHFVYLRKTVTRHNLLTVLRRQRLDAVVPYTMIVFYLNSAYNCIFLEFSL